MGNLRAKSVDFLLAIRSRRNSLGQEAPVLTFDGILIDGMGLETIVFQTLLESPIAASSADNIAGILLAFCALTLLKS